MALVFAGEWQAGLALIDEAATAAVVGPARSARGERHLLQHDRRLPERRGSEAGGTVGRGRGALDASPDRSAATRASAASIAPSSSGSAATGPRPSRRRARRARSSNASGSWMPSGYAQYEVGEVRLRMGDLDAAAEAFERAYEYGHDAQPGMALLHLARGEIDEAARSIGRALAATAGSDGPPTGRPEPACSRPRSTSRSRPATSRRPAPRSPSWSRSPPISSDPCSRPAR